MEETTASHTIAKFQEPVALSVRRSALFKRTV
jgi:hypothetical protein